MLWGFCWDVAQCFLSAVFAMYATSAPSAWGYKKHTALQKVLKGTPLLLKSAKFPPFLMLPFA